MDPASLILGALFIEALTDKKPAAPAPPPPPVPPGGGGSTQLAGDLGKLAGTGAAGLISLFGGGGASAGGDGAATIAAAGTTAATEAGGEASTVVGAELVSVSTFSVGGAFAFAWAAFFVLQFVVINALTGARVQWLRYRNSVLDLNAKPFAHLHNIERALVNETLDNVLHLQWHARNADDRAVDGSLGQVNQDSDGNYSDPRLSVQTLFANEASQTFINYPYWRQLYDNPFTDRGDGTLRGATTAQRNNAWEWRLLQMCARLVAARYVFELARFSAGMLTSFPGLGGHPTTGLDSSTVDQLWHYPLLGGGQPDKSYADFEAELRALGPQGGITIDDVLNAARLAAILHVAATVKADPQLFVGWDPAIYSINLFNAFGLNAAPQYHVQLQGQQWVFDGAFYKVPCTHLALDIDDLKAGKPLQPFVGGTTAPTPPFLTALKAL